MEKNKVKLSIIVPIYKTERYLVQCVESILTQRFTDYELILVNDGSPDGSAGICDEYAMRNEKIRVVHKKNGGLVSARIAGLQVAKGEYIGYVDSDDWIDSDYFFNMMEVVEKFGVQVVCSLYTEAYEHEERLPMEQYPSGVYRENKLRDLKEKMIYQPPYFNFGIYPSVWSKVIKREILETYQLSVPTSITLGEDAAVIYPMLWNECSSLYILNENTGYHYRQTTESMVHKYNPCLIDNVLTLISYLNVGMGGENVYLSQKNWMVYYLMLIKWVIGNELNARRRTTAVVGSINRFRSAESIARLMERADLSMLPTSVKWLLQLFRTKQYTALILLSRLYKFLF